ncbi:hypothetical protein LXL04_020387 [Taraxacum kok-saghyz]
MTATCDDDALLPATPSRVSPPAATCDDCYLRRRSATCDDARPKASLQLRRRFAKSTPVRKEGAVMNFIESVFSFVFGDGDPNEGIEEERWKLIGQYITSNGGVVTAEELAPYLDVETADIMVMALKERGIRAEHLSTAQTNTSAQKNAESGQYDLLYMTPEKACNIPNRVRNDIIGSLMMKNPRIAIGSFDRKNLYYGVKSINRGVSFIVNLTLLFIGSLTMKAREESHRFTKSLESYYQESGRCGRDGIGSDCWIYFSRGDFGKTDFYCAEASSVC